MLFAKCFKIHFYLLFYFMKGNFNNGNKFTDTEPTTDGKIGLEDDSLG